MKQKGINTAFDELVKQKPLDKILSNQLLEALINEISFLCLKNLVLSDKL